MKFSFQCCFTSTETFRLIRDGEPRTATSAFTQLLSSDINKLSKNTSQQRSSDVTHTTRDVTVIIPVTSVERPF